MDFLLAPTKNIDTYTSFVTPYASSVEMKSKIMKEKYMINVDEWGLTNSVKIAPTTAKVIKNDAINIVVSMATLPKKSK
jgi:hypothetical protein